MDLNKAIQKLKKYFIMYYGEDKKEYITDKLNNITPYLCYTTEEYEQEFFREINKDDSYGQVLYYKQLKIDSEIIKYNKKYLLEIADDISKFINIQYNFLECKIHNVSFDFSEESKIDYFMEKYVVDDDVLNLYLSSKIDLVDNKRINRYLSDLGVIDTQEYIKNNDMSKLVMTTSKFNKVVNNFVVYFNKINFEKTLINSSFFSHHIQIDSEELLNCIIANFFYTIQSGNSCADYIKIDEKEYNLLFFSIYSGQKCYRDLDLIHEVNHLITIRMVDDNLRSGIFLESDLESRGLMEAINHYQAIEITKLMHNDNCFLYSSKDNVSYKNYLIYEQIMPLARPLFIKYRELFKNLCTVDDPKTFDCIIESEYINLLKIYLNDSLEVYENMITESNYEKEFDTLYKCRVDTLDLYRKIRKNKLDIERQ